MAAGEYAVSALGEIKLRNVVVKALFSVLVITIMFFPDRIDDL